MNALHSLWKAQADRIEALSLRERCIMLASIALALGALADWWAISPAMAERGQLSAQLRKQATELSVMRAQLSAGRQALPDTPLSRQLAAIEQARSERDALEARVRGLLAGRTELARLNDVLDEVLRRHERLTLIRLSTVTDLPPSAPVRNGAAAIHWRGVDLSVAGRYLDLMQYLADLERTLPGLRWGELHIASKTTPPELTVRLLMAGETP